MFSKFSVLSKFFKNSYSKQNGLRRMIRCECRTLMTRRRYLTKNHTNLLLGTHEANNIAAIHSNVDTNFQISRNMGSNNNKGDGQQPGSSNKTKRLMQKRKKKFLRRRSKVKSLKVTQMKCKRCKTKKQRDANNEKLIAGITQHIADLPHKKDLPAGISNMNISEVPNNQGILQSHLPQKKVHVEFMESQNLKDFNLKNSPSSELVNTNNETANTIEIQIKPINYVNEKKPSNVKSIEVDIKNAIHNLETQHLTKSNQVSQKKKTLKSWQKTSKTAMGIKRNFQDVKKLSLHNINIEISPQNIESVTKKSNTPTVKAHNIADTVTTSKNSLLPERDSLHKTFSNHNISRRNNSSPTVCESSENIRILYQDRPKRKTKIKIPKRMKAKQIKLSEPPLQNQNNRAEPPKQLKGILFPTEPCDQNNKAMPPNQLKGILFPTKPGEFLNFKIKSKKLTTDQVKPFVTLRKGILYPTKKCEPNNDSSLKDQIKPLPNIDTNLLQISTTTKVLDNRKTEIKSGIHKEVTKGAVNFNNVTNTIQRTPTNPRLEGLKNPNNGKVTSISGCIHKIIHCNENSKKTSNGENSSTGANMFSEYMSADKLKDVDTQFKAVNTVPKGSRPLPKISTHKKHGTTTLKTNKLTKTKRSSRGGNRGDNFGGDGGNKTAINKEATTTAKTRPSRFWRTISLSILPLILGFTVYTISNIGAAEMFKRMRYTSSSVDPFSMKILPTFYGKKTENEESDLNEDRSEEEDEEDHLNDNKNESEKLDEHFSEPRLDEA